MRRLTSRAVLLVAIAHGGALRAETVIDLGKLQIEGKQRGPEVHLTDPLRMGESTATLLYRRHVKQLEAELLKPYADTTTREEQP